MPIIPILSELPEVRCGQTLGEMPIILKIPHVRALPPSQIGLALPIGDGRRL